jgi:hypothetical protein
VPDIDVDQILSNIEKTGSAEGAPAPVETTPPAASTTQQTAPEPVTEYEYQAAGKTIKEPLDMILKRASQGYHYAQNNQALKAEREAFEKDRTGLLEKVKGLEVYAPIDEFAKANPGWTEFVRDEWQKKQAGEGAVDPALKRVMDKLDAHEKTIAILDGARTIQQREIEDRALGQEVEGIRQKYGQYDWVTPDASSGLSLEMQVLQHAEKHGIKRFSTAFHDYYHEELVKRGTMEGKEAQMKAEQAQRKSGVISQTSQPKAPTGLQPATNLKKKSYDDLTREALAELGISL